MDKRKRGIDYEEENKKPKLINLENAIYKLNYIAFDSSSSASLAVSDTV